MNRFAAIFLILVHFTASSQPAKIAEAISRQSAMYQDFFSFETHGKRLRYDIRTEFSTSMGEEYLKTKARSALQVALAKTLSGPGEQKLNLATLKGNFEAALVKELVMTLLFFKVIASTVQYDVHFVPVIDNPENLSTELSSNQLVRLNDTGKLLSKLQGSRANEQAQSLVKGSKFLAQTRNSNDPIYVGGTISLHLDIAKINLAQLNNIKKNAIQGYIRYRRYYLPSQGSLSTVDVYKTFNSEFNIQTDRVEIYPGQIKDINDSSRDVVTSGPLDLQVKGLSAGQFSRVVYRMSDGFIETDFQNIETRSEENWLDTNFQKSVSEKVANELKDRELQGLNLHFFLNQLGVSPHGN